MDIDSLYEETIKALAIPDYVKALDYADKLRLWCNSDDAKQYSANSVEGIRSFANLINLNYASLTMV